MKTSGRARKRTLEEFIGKYVCANLREFESALSHIRSSSGRNMIFRGHADDSWPLASSLERFVSTIMPDKFGGTFLAQCEDLLLADFKRGAHLHSAEQIAAEDRLGWLALMQHHGTPTRLLDWTTSPYVALYFAIEPESATTGCVWIIDLQMLEFGDFELWRRLEESGRVKTALDYLGTLIETETPDERTRYFNALASDANKLQMPGIVAVRPFRMHRRLTAQQGLFLVPLSSSKSFSDSLVDILRVRVKDVGPLGALIYKIRLVNHTRSDLLRQLWEMNINHATLFPGLDGFAHSLRTRFELEGLRNRL